LGLKPICRGVLMESKDYCSKEYDYIFMDRTDTALANMAFKDEYSNYIIRKPDTYYYYAYYSVIYKNWKRSDTDLMDQKRNILKFLGIKMSELEFAAEDLFVFFEGPEKATLVL
jgi:hypothetical protein